jgi:hypothetical protein
MWVICPIPAQFPGKWKRWLELTRYLPGVLYTTKKSQDRDGWALHFPLQWKGLMAAKPRKGLLMLNVSAGRPRKTKNNATDVSLVRHLYGPAFRPEMEGAVTNLCDVINRISKMKFDHPRNVLPKGLIRSLCSGPQDHPMIRTNEGYAWSKSSRHLPSKQPKILSSNSALSYSTHTCFMPASVALMQCQLSTPTLKSPCIMSQLTLLWQMQRA